MKKQQQFEVKDVFIGLDVHRSFFVAGCICEGEVVKRCRMPPTAEAVLSLIVKEFRGANVSTCYESGYSGFWLHRALTAQGVSLPDFAEATPRKCRRRKGLDKASMATAGKTTYRRRIPEKTNLYRIVYQARDDLERVWEERFQPEFGVLREVVTETLDEYLNCGILAHGFARAECDGCGHSIAVAFSCKKRGVCPSCAAKRAVVFAEHMETEVLEKVPHRHLVLSLPKRLRAFFRYDRRLLSILFTAAWQSIKELFDAVLPGTSPGAVLCVQSHGDSLNFNPHIHGIATDGGFLPDGTWKPLGVADPQKLQTLFMHRVLTALKDKELIDDVVIEQIVNQTHSGFSAWWGEPIPPDDAAQRLFLSRYIDRGPIAESRISITDDIITYLTPKDDITHEFEPLEFLARLTPHIANRWESTTRYFGWYSSRARGKRNKLNKLNVSATISAAQPLQKKKASKRWAALIKRIFEVDPLVCPKCEGPMRIREFLTGQTKIKAALQAMQLLWFVQPERVRGPPLAQAFVPDPDYLEFLASQS